MKEVHQRVKERVSFSSLDLQETCKSREGKNYLGLTFTVVSFIECSPKEHKVNLGQT
jgi:hypothetical protein